MMTIQQISDTQEGRTQKKYVAWQMYLSFVGLALGGLFGLFQAFDRAGYDAYAEGGVAGAIEIGRAHV